jgi:uncharacterized membrane protein YhaH (DUF805 family)
MFAAVKYNLANLFRFSGRDARPTFWYFVLFLYVLGLVVSLAWSVPIMVQSAMVGMHMAQHSGADEAAVQAAILASVGTMMKPMLYIGIASGILFIVLLAAGLVRRLHDSDLSGWFALIPGGLQVLSLAQLPLQMDRVTGAVVQVQGRMLHGASMTTHWPGALLGWAPLIALVLVAARRPSPGANRFGPEPVIR